MFPVIADRRVVQCNVAHHYHPPATRATVNDIDLEFVDETVERLGRRTEAVIPILQAIQSHFRYLPREAMERVCRLTEITPATIEGVSTFYTQFRHQPVGKHIISVCHGTACHVKGSELVQDALERHLGIGRGSDTDAKGLFTVEKVACLGCCTLAPVIQIDSVTYGNLNSHRAGEVIEAFLSHDREGRPSDLAAAVHDGPVGEIRVGLGSCCVAQGSGKVHETICRTLAATGAPAVVKQVGCVGMCHQTPLVELIPPGGGPSKLFARVQAEDARAIVLSQYQPKGLWRRMAHRAGGWFDRFLSDETSDPVTDRAIDVRDRPVCAFLGPQRHVATEYCGQIDPTDLDEYIHHDGLKALRHCLEDLSPEQIIEQVRASGLRGRGGAGFPTGQKWATARAAAGEKKYVICNGDEGDPGAFMDRMLLESFPYRIIEGMAIAARAVGADEGIFYIRAEYPLAVKRIREALQQAGRPRPAGRPRAEHRLSLAPFGEGRGRGLRLRRGDGLAGLVGRPPRHAPAASALPGRVGPVGPADLREQRRNLCHGPLDLPQRGRGLRPAGHGKEQGDQGLCPGRQGRAAAG